MGKQNFIQGGFSGRVGMLVGAQWHDIYTVRAYAKPSNPRTPEQQANRARFAKRVEACKLALGANWKAPFWETGNRPAWSYLMRDSAKMYADDKNILEYVPLIPYGYSPEYPASDEPEVSGSSVTLFFDTQDNLLGRVLSVLVYALKDGADVYETQTCIASVTGTAGSWSAVATLPDGFVFGDDTFVAAVSRDDAAHSNTTLYQPAVHTGPAIPVVEFTLSSPVVEGFAAGDDGYLFDLAPSVALPTVATFALPAVARGVLQGEWSTATAEPYSAISNGRLKLGDFMNIDARGQRPQFVSGSTLTIPAFTFVADGTKWQFNGATFDLAETATEQILYDFASHETFTNDYGSGYVFGDAVQVTEGDFGRVSYVENNAVSTWALKLIESSGNIFLSFYGNRNYWGKTRSLALQAAAKFNIKGVPYTVPAGTLFDLVPYKTSAIVNVAERTVSATCFHDDDGGWSTARIGETPDGQAATLWGSHGLPTVSITANGVTRSWGTKTPSNSGAITFFFGYDVPYIGANGTCTFSFPETFTETVEIANTDGFKTGLSVTAGTQTGEYTFVDG